MSKTKPATDTVDPLAATAPQPRIEAPAEASADEAQAGEIERLRREVTEARETIDALNRELDARRRDLDELLDAPPRGRAAELREVDPATIALALCEVYRVSQAGGGNRARYLAAALRAGDRLADVVLGPADAPPAG